MHCNPDGRKILSALLIREALFSVLQEWGKMSANHVSLFNVNPPNSVETSPQMIKERVAALEDLRSDQIISKNPPFPPVAERNRGSSITKHSSFSELSSWKHPHQNPVRPSGRACNPRQTGFLQ